MCAASNLLLGVAVLVVLTAFAAAASSRNVSALKCYEGKNEDYKEGTGGCRSVCTTEIKPAGDIIRGCDCVPNSGGHPDQCIPCGAREDCNSCNKNLCNEVVNATAFPDRLKCYVGGKYDGKPGTFKEKFCAKGVKYCFTEYFPAKPGAPIGSPDAPNGSPDVPGRTEKNCNDIPCTENWFPGGITCADCKENLCNAAIGIVGGGIFLAIVGFVSSLMPTILLSIGGFNDVGGLHFY